MIKLDEKIYEIENEYLQLLQNIKKNITENNIKSSLDNIRLFWYKNRKVVSMFLQTLNDKQAFSYSGASHLDVNDKEYYGFLAVGEIHIMDDQLYKYADCLLQAYEVSGNEIIKKQVFTTLDDNICLLKDLKEIILLLPVRLFFTNNLEIIHKAAEQCFISFFNQKFDSLNDYFNTCKTAEDIDKYLSDDIKKSIFICDKDRFDLEFIERIKLLPNDFFSNNDVEKFFHSLIGFIISVLEILESMHDYGIIPIIRNPATLSYLYLLEPNLSKDITFLNKTVLANEVFVIINQNMNKFEDYTPKEMNDLCKENNIFELLYKDFELSTKSVNQINFNDRVEMIKTRILNIADKSI